jgi:hypothetical protein
MRGKAIPDDIRAAIAADMAAGDTRKVVAARYGVSEGAVKRYSPLAKVGRVYRSKLVSVNQLGERYLELLDKNFAALGALSDYIAEHPGEVVNHPTGAAVTYGVIFDKTGKVAGAAMASAGLDPAALSGPNQDDDRPDRGDDPDAAQ